MRSWIFAIIVESKIIYRYSISIIDDLVSLKSLYWDKEKNKDEVQELHDNDYYHRFMSKPLPKITKRKQFNSIIELNKYIKKNILK